jgi:hypothetical protein
VNRANRNRKNDIQFRQKQTARETCPRAVLLFADLAENYPALAAAM